jgi:hypothetical protein
VHVQVALPKLSLDKFTDSYFKAAEKKQQKGKKGEDEFFKKGGCHMSLVRILYESHMWTLPDSG